DQDRNSTCSLRNSVSLRRGAAGRSSVNTLMSSPVRARGAPALAGCWRTLTQRGSTWSLSGNSIGWDDRWCTWSRSSTNSWARGSTWFPRLSHTWTPPLLRDGYSATSSRQLPSTSVSLSGSAFAPARLELGPRVSGSGGGPGWAASRVRNPGGFFRRLEPFIDL